MSAPARLLAALKRSKIFAADFPKRPRFTHAQMALLSEDEQRESGKVAVEAIRRVPEFAELAEIGYCLGEAKYENAVPTLAEIWRECALEPLRNAAGHALRAIGSPAARSALEEQIDDSDWFSVVMAIRAIFDSAPTDAYDKLSPYFDAQRLSEPGGCVIPAQTLSFLSPNSFSNDGPHWTDERVPGCLRQDRRWIDLCVKLRHDARLGYPARKVLRYVEPTLFQASLDAARKTEPPQLFVPRTQAFGNLVARYLAGEHTEVWQVLRSFEAIDGDLRKEAEAVALETMKRVAHNVDLLASRFASKGWQALGGRLRTKPESAGMGVFAEIERITKGPIPPSLLAFWRVVGGVDLVWDYNTDRRPPDLLLGIALNLDELDPLCVEAPANVTWLFDGWEDDIRQTHPELLDPFSLHLAGDYLHKANISGGPPYGIELPFFGADPVFQNEEHELPFVDYLRHTLRWAGFSRLERHANEKGVSALVESLTDGFMPF